MKRFGAAVPDADSWASAEKAIVRLAPSAFPDLPAPLKSHLTQIGCTIPQSFADEQPHNVIKGQFRRRGQTDWAVLCHRGDTTSLLVFWEGAPEKSEELSKGKDEGFLQTTDGNGTIGFSHLIATVGKEDIMAYYEGFGGAPPPAPLDHEGIDDAFYNKASGIHYWHDGKWLGLQGAD